MELDLFFIAHNITKLAVFKPPIFEFNYNLAGFGTSGLFFLLLN